MDIINLSAWDIHEKIINRELTAVEVVKAFLDSISQKEEHNAFITINEAAIAKAEEIDEKIRNNEEVGALAGIPIGVKDNISTYGIKTTCGSKMLENYVPPFDATVIERIREEDGIVIGKTNLDEFAVGETSETSYFGPTLNPIDKSRVAGGSSGGSAAAVRLSQAPLALGTDTGGSVRQPAAFCGIVGMKPTYGAISRYGVVSMANSMDQVGVCAMDVRDSAMLLSVLMDHDIKDSTSDENAGELLRELDLSGNSLEGKTIGVVKELMDLNIDEDVRKSFERNLEILKAEGAEVEEISLEHIKYASKCYQVLSSVELSSNMARYDGVRFGHRAKDYKDLDELYINSRSEGFGERIKKRIALGTYLSSGENRDKYYVQALKLRRLIKEELDEALEKLDFIVTPTATVAAYEADKKDNNDYKDDIWTIFANLAGLPAITVPAGEVDGCPMGLQLVARAYGDKELLEAAFSFEGGFRNGL